MIFCCLFALVYLPLRIRKRTIGSCLPRGRRLCDGLGGMALLLHVYQTSGYGFAAKLALIVWLAVTLVKV
jgi:hypothetical protein